MCEDCGNELTDRDREVFERENGEGWPATCEECAETAAFSVKGLYYEGEY